MRCGFRLDAAQLSPENGCENAGFVDSDAGSCHRLRLSVRKNRGEDWYGAARKGISKCARIFKCGDEPVFNRIPYYAEHQRHSADTDGVCHAVANGALCADSRYRGCFEGYGHKNGYGMDHCCGSGCHYVTRAYFDGNHSAKV